jgi:hypothetical protein
LPGFCSYYSGGERCSIEEVAEGRVKEVVDEAGVVSAEEAEIKPELDPAGTASVPNVGTSKPMKWDSDAWIWFARSAARLWCGRERLTPAAGYRPE